MVATQPYSRQQAMKGASRSKDKLLDEGFDPWLTVSKAGGYTVGCLHL
jgi:hypothetical protein